MGSCNICGYKADYIKEESNNIEDMLCGACLNEYEEEDNVQYKYKVFDESGEHPEYYFGIEWSSDLEGILIDHIKWYETEEERDRVFNESDALDALKIMEEKNEKDLQS